jgi:hypothetical protein
MAHAVLSGKARQGGMGHAYAEEVVETMHGKKMSNLPTKVRGKIGRPKR